jgi:hypothetical protein
VLSIDAPAFFDRDTVYGALDDGERYLAFCALVAALIDATGFAPDIVHGFEWPAAALLARLAAAPGGPATVLASREGSSGYVVAAAALQGAGVSAAGFGEVDLLDLARRAVTVVDTRPRHGTVAALYEAALAGIQGGG